MKTNLVKWAVVLMVSGWMMAGSMDCQAQMLPGPWGYAPTPYGGYATQSSIVQTAGYQNTYSTPFGGTTQWGQSQLTGHTLQAGQYGPFGASQFQVSGHSIQYQMGQIYW